MSKTSKKSTVALPPHIRRRLRRIYIAAWQTPPDVAARARRWRAEQRRKAKAAKRRGKVT